MKITKKYISDCENFEIVDGQLFVYNERDIEGLYKFLCEYLGKDAPIEVEVIENEN